MMTTDAKMSPEAPDEGPLTSFQRAARLADADELTETRVADAIQDAVSALHKGLFHEQAGTT